MSKEPPILIAIDPDDYHATYVGRTADGSQFFLTTPFVPATGDSVGCEFVALYLFDAQGGLREVRINNLGARTEMQDERPESVLKQRLAELGPLNYCRIMVQPFQLEQFGVIFGLVPCAPENEDGYWSVEAQPGNYMAFYEPWDSGEYDT